MLLDAYLLVFKPSEANNFSDVICSKADDVDTLRGIGCRANDNEANHLLLFNICRLGNNLSVMKYEKTVSFAASNNGMSSNSVCVIDSLNVPH